VNPGTFWQRSTLCAIPSSTACVCTLRMHNTQRLLELLDNVVRYDELPIGSFGVTVVLLLLMRLLLLSK